MSYAAVAASGPKQSAEDARAPALPEVEHTEDSVSSLVDVDSPHISSVPSDYSEQAVKTDTQAERVEREEDIHEAAERRERLEREEEIQKAAREIKEKAAHKKEAAKEAAKQAAKDKAAAAKDKAATAKDKAVAAKDKMSKNADNPVILGNTIGLAVVGGLLSIGAYRKYARGELTGKVVAAWAGVVGLFAAGDYYVSQYYFERYPPKN